ncbi:hypothetical protein DIPPA_22549 [Diplonema papillatum]|nr:hypothetical protein DIPPA_22549 [Diplonema papillatum]
MVSAPVAFLASTADEPVQKLIKAAAAWAGVEEFVEESGWRHTRRGSKPGDRPNATAIVGGGFGAAELQGLVLLFDALKWKVEAGITRGRFKGLRLLLHPRDYATRLELARLEPHGVPCRWAAENAVSLEVRQLSMLAASEADRNRIAALDKIIAAGVGGGARADSAGPLAERRRVAERNRELRLARLRQRQRDVSELEKRSVACPAAEPVRHLPQPPVESR